MMRSVCRLLYNQNLLLPPKAQRVERCSDAAAVLREVRYGQKRPIANPKCNSKGRGVLQKYPWDFGWLS